MPLLSYILRPFWGPGRVMKLFVDLSFRSGQIIATSPQKPQKVALWKGNPLISGKSRLVKYYEPFGQIHIIPTFKTEILFGLKQLIDAV